jgi:membrane-associated HD superfamily phosphohydrolase
MKKIIPTQKELDIILKMYNNENLGSVYISQKTGISRPTILRILKDSGVDMKPSGRRSVGGKKVADKKWREKNKKYMSEKSKEWYERNKDYRKDYLKQYREKNIDKIRETKRNYEKTRKSNDPIYKLINNFRTAIYQVLKENNVKKNGHYFEILKYTPEELITHLENQFLEGMTWENYGEWHVDHKLPISIHNVQEIGDDEFMKCWSLENLQPLWGTDNIRKSNKVI